MSTQMTMNILTHQSSTILSCSCHLSLCSAWRLRRCITRNEHGDRSMTATLHECHKLWRALGDNHGATKDAAKRPVTGVTPTRSCLGTIARKFNVPWQRVHHSVFAVVMHEVRGHAGSHWRYTRTNICHLRPASFQHYQIRPPLPNTRA